MIEKPTKAVSKAKRRARKRESRTAALISRGVLRDLEQARFCGFDLTLEQSETARAMPMGSESQAQHNRVMADLQAITDRQAAHATEVAEKRRIVNGEAA